MKVTVVFAISTKSAMFCAALNHLGLGNPLHHGAVTVC
jgi:hypothetical protein